MIIGEASGESIIIYLIGNLFLLKIKAMKKLHKLQIWKIYLIKLKLAFQMIKDATASE